MDHGFKSFEFRLSASKSNDQYYIEKVHLPWSPGEFIIWDVNFFRGHHEKKGKV